jgi:hypothetical protein
MVLALDGEFQAINPQTQTMDFSELGPGDGHNERHVREPDPARIPTDPTKTMDRPAQQGEITMPRVEGDWKGGAVGPTDEAIPE